MCELFGFEDYRRELHGKNGTVSNQKNQLSTRGSNTTDKENDWINVKTVCWKELSGIYYV